MTDKYDDFRKKLCDNEYSIAYVKREIAGSTWTAEQKEIAKEWLRDRLERFNDWVPGNITFE